MAAPRRELAAAKRSSRPCATTRSLWLTGPPALSTRYGYALPTTGGAIKRGTIDPAHRFTVGEGANFMQSPRMTTRFFQDAMNDRVWGRQMRDLVKQSDC